MSATDELRRLLDERGVEYETDERNAITRWSTYYGAFVYFARQREGKLLVETTVATEHSVILTPEQAIAATLVDDAYDAVANEHVITAEQLHALLDEWDKHPGRAATDGEMMTYATLGGGKLTAEQVRKTVEKHWHDLPAEYDMPEATALPEYSYDWQAIADELNARAERTCEIVEWHEARDRHEIGNNRVRFSCGHFGTCHFKFCAECGAKVVGE